MTSRRFPILLAILVALSGAPSARADESALARAEKLLEDPSRAKEAMELLAKLPLEQKQSVDYHHVLASACCAAGEVRDAAEALVTSALLPASPARSFESIRTRLAQSAKESFRLALEDQGRGNLTAAVKSYLIATKLDPSVLGQDDKGLRETALKGLAQAAAKSPERADHQYRLGFYAYLFGRPDDAVAPFEASVRLQTDPYLRWKNQLWFTKVQREVSEARKAEEAEKKKRKAKASTVYLPRSTGQQPAEDTAKRQREDENALYVRDLEERIAQVDANIKYGENLKATNDTTYNWKKVKAKLEYYRELKKKLEFELANLK
jgi:hypothetical protein